MLGLYKLDPVPVPTCEVLSSTIDLAFAICGFFPRIYTDWFVVFCKYLGCEAYPDDFDKFSRAGDPEMRWVCF